MGLEAIRHEGNKALSRVLSLDAPFWLKGLKVNGLKGKNRAHLPARHGEGGTGVPTVANQPIKSKSLRFTIEQIVTSLTNKLDHHVGQSSALLVMTGWRDFINPDFIKNLLPYGPIALLPQRLAFTMAEILISLTIIGVIAAITLPSLRANINEKAWATQRKALYSRLSQAIAMLPSMNGYGVVMNADGTLNTNATASGAGQVFVSELNKVLKINNICDSTNLSKCGIPANFKTFGGIKKNFPTKMSELDTYYMRHNPHTHVDGNAVAFETANGESVAVFYNPFCVDKDLAFAPVDTSWGDNAVKNVYPYFCAAFLFDLNGKKGPNKMGKDMWFINALYPTEPSVVMFDPDKITKYGGVMNFNKAKQYCASQNARMANLDEGIAAHLTLTITGAVFGWLGADTGVLGYGYLVANGGNLVRFSGNNGVRCIKR